MKAETCPKCGESYTPGMTVHCALMDKCYYTAPNVRTDDAALVARLRVTRPITVTLVEQAADRIAALNAELAKARKDIAELRETQRKFGKVQHDLMNRADALREALREQTVVLDPMAWKADAKWCELCCTGWIHPGPERHAPGCLAARAEQEGK